MDKLVKNQLPTIEDFLNTYDDQRFNEELFNLDHESLVELFNIAFQKFLIAINSDLHLTKSIAILLLNFAEKMNDNFLVARAWGFLGLSYYNLCHYKDALDCFEKSLNFFILCNNYEKIIGTRVNIGITLHQIGDYQGAIEEVKTVENIIAEHNLDVPLVRAAILHNSALSFDKLGKVSKSLGLFDRAISIYAEHNLSEEKYSVITDKCLCLISNSEFEEATLILKKTLNDKRIDQFPSIKGHIYLNLGNAERARANLSESFKYFEDAKFEFSRLNNESEYSIAEINQAYLFLLLGMWKESIYWSQKALPILKKNGIRYEAANAYEIITLAFSNLNLWRVSKKYYDKCLKIYEELKTPVQILRIKLLFWEKVFEGNHGKFAIEDLYSQKSNEGFEIPKYLEFRYLAIEAKFRLSSKNKNINNSIIHHLKKIEVLSQELGSKEAQIISLNIWGKYYLCIGKFQDGFNYFKKSIQVFIDLSLLIPRKEFLIHLLKKHSCIFQDLIECCHLFDKLDFQKQQWIVITRYFQSAMYRVHQTSKDLQAEQHLKLTNLQEKWQSLQHYYFNLDFEEGKSNQIPKRIRKEIISLEYEILQISRKHAKGLFVRGFVGKSDLASLQEMFFHEGKNINFLENIQTRLNNMDIYVHYYYASNALNCFLISKKCIEIKQNLIDIDELEDLINSWKIIILNHFHGYLVNDSIINKYLQRFFKVLVFPFFKDLRSNETLFVSNHKNLANIPFPALKLNEDFLFEHLNVIPIQDPLTINQHLTKEVSDAKKHNLLLISSVDNDRLENVDREIRTIKNIIPKSWAINDMRAKQNNNMSLKKSLESADLIHIASHSIIRDDNSLMSWLMVGDRRITLNELQNINLLRKPIVFINSCSGMERNEENGFTSIADEFLSAGALAIIGTPWPINDEVAKEISKAFYQDIFENNLMVDMNKLYRKLINLNIDSLDWAGYKILH